MVIGILNVFKINRLYYKVDIFIYYPKNIVLFYKFVLLTL